MRPETFLRKSGNGNRHRRADVGNQVGRGEGIFYTISYSDYLVRFRVMYKSVHPHESKPFCSVVSLKLQIQEVKFGRNARHNILNSAITFWFMTIRINLCKTDKYKRIWFYPRSELPPDKILSCMCEYGVTSKQSSVLGQAPNVVCLHFQFSSFHVLLYLILSGHNRNISSTKYKMVELRRILWGLHS